MVGARREAFPYVGLSAGSPGLALLSEALRRVSIPGVPTITDGHPLMHPPTGIEAAASRGAGQATVIILLASAVGLVLLRSMRT